MGKSSEKEKNVHANHRQRMINKFMQNGLDIFEDHEVIELLLFWILPRLNTNPIAHEMLNTFGSIHAMMEATPEQLQQVHRIGERSAQSLCFLREFFRYYEQKYAAQVKEDVPLRSLSEICAYSRRALASETTEVLFVIYLNNAGCVLHQEKIEQGTICYAQFTLRNIIELALCYNAVSIVLVHYYPCDVRDDSFAQDITTKTSLQYIFSHLPITLLDLIILSPDYSHSLFRL